MSPALSVSSWPVNIARRRLKKVNGASGRRKLFVALFAAVIGVATLRAQTNPPTEWIDPDTGHRVVQLSREPGSESLYFNLNPFTPDGKRMVFTSPTGIAMVDLETRRIEKIVSGRSLRVIMVGRKTGTVYYLKPQIAGGKTNRLVCAVNPVTGITREILELSRGQAVATVNADETLLAGTITWHSDWTNNFFENETNVEDDIRSADAYRARKGGLMRERLARHYPMALFTYNLRTGKIKIFNRGTDWLNHLLFSPTDPHLLMFCHEGPWQKVDRIWTIRTDGTHLTLIHRRTMAMEIAGHEFWSADGSTIWYDLQTPRGEDFWVAGCNVHTGARTWYHLARNEWSVHYNVSPDGTLFCGDGGDERMVAHASDGKWLYLFRPELLPNDTGPDILEKHLIQPGVFHAEKLVNLRRHDYALEPNAMFSPDMKWIIFRSNLSGANQIYAVELQPGG